MKILLIGAIPQEKGGRYSGGVSTHVWELTWQLKKRQHKVFIFADNFTRQFDSIESVPVWGISNKILRTIKMLENPNFFYAVLTNLRKKKHSSRTLIRFIWWKYFYERLIEKIKPDLVHSHLISHLITMTHKSSSITNKIPLLFTVHSFHSILFSKEKEKNLVWEITRDNINSADMLLLVAPGLSEQMEELGFKRPKRLKVVTNPLNLEEFSHGENGEKDIEKIEKTKPLIIFVGILVKRKGEEDLIRASKLLLKKGVLHTLVILGGGPNEENAKRLATKEGLENTVVFGGTVSRGKVIEYLTRADIMVLPSYSESLSYSILEAYAAGTPVITTYEAVEKAQDILYPGPEFGFLVHAGEPLSLAEAIEKGLKKKWNTQTLKNYAFRFSWEKSIVKYENIYRGLVKGD